MSATGAPARLLDTAPGTLAERFAPEWARPYVRLARLDRPIGWKLLLLPCWWSAALAAIAAENPWPNPYHLLLFLIGAIAMRGAGSTWNDLLDRDIDAKVERTRARPLPAGEVRPRAAFLFMGVLALVGAGVLVSFNGFSIGLGLASLAVVAIYPLMKRITFWPQAVLGLAFAWGALMGWAALFGSLDWPPLLLYAGAIAWTIAYDTIYALQDLRDDSIIGVRSTARLFGGRVRLAVASFQALTVLLVTLSLILVGGNIFGYLGCAGFAAHLAWQTASIDSSDPTKALMLFRSNWTAGLILFAGLLADAFIASA
ncbi:MAG: 4-hydroxybenzoate octaprenyltransferase [Hyphomicrobiales bacterium]|nr:4-hydroxybenzoate octaprenyltransferase [Hyphomicrobiales bacterium]